LTPLSEKEKQGAIEGEIENKLLELINGIYIFENIYIFNDVFTTHKSPFLVAASTIGDTSKFAHLHFQKWRRALATCDQFHTSLILISHSWIFDMSPMSLLTCHHPISDIF
jgi:hypothetical protein